MARGVNKVILVGNLGADPEVRYLQSGAAVAVVSIATSSAYKDKKTDKIVETTEWHRVVFFARLAEIVGQYLFKGSKVYIEGSLRTRKWQDKASGADRYITEVIAHEMQMLDGKKAGSSAGREEENPYLKGEASEGGQPLVPSDGETYQDDIPF